VCVNKVLENKRRIYAEYERVTTTGGKNGEKSLWNFILGTQHSKQYT
jgi:hypothetical protein